MKDIVCAEAELSIAANQIANYANFLAAAIETYTNILDSVREKGINDLWVRIKLQQLISRVGSYKPDITNQGDEIQKVIRTYIDNIEKADNFKFPEDPSSEISRLLAQFV